MTKLSFLVALTVAILSWPMAARPAETIKLGVSRLASCAPIAIALDKGYFTAEGLEPELVYFDSQQPIAVAVVSGDIDFGMAAETAALYTLAGQGQLRVIGGGPSEAPSFHYLSILASNRAYAGGLKSPRDLGGHSDALTQLGTGLQYAMGLLAEKYGFDIKTINFLPLQSNANIASALAGGQADASIFSSTGALPLIEKGDAKLLGWVGDETGLDQAYLFFAGKKTAEERRDTIERLLRAFRKATHDYHDAFTDASGKRADGPTAPAILAIIAKYLGQPVEQVKIGLPYFDRDARVGVKTVQHQIEWYRSQGLLKGDVTADALIDRRYVIPLPER